MRRFVEGMDRGQSTLFPDCLEDWLDENNPVRVVNVFVDELDLGELGFSGVDPKITGRPSYHPSVLLKLYIYGYLNWVQSSRRLEREALRNVEVMWLLGTPGRWPSNSAGSIPCLACLCCARARRSVY
jgi:transposase